MKKILIVVLVVLAALAAMGESGESGMPGKVAGSAGFGDLPDSLGPVHAAPAASNERCWRLIGLSEHAHFVNFRHPVKVAIIDDGFDIDNPLWAGSIAHNKADIPGNDIDDDHNGKADDYEGWDFGDNDADVRPVRSVIDKEYHGTRVLGVFWEVLQQLSAGAPAGVSILPIKAVADGHLNNYLMEGYKGIEYAIEQKADVIICSWSGPMISPEEKAILAKAQARGILIIAAAGNYYSLEPMFPGAYPSVIDVAATTAEGRKLSISNYGNFVDISAPGDSLLTYDPYAHSPTAWLSATSAAAPVVGAIVTAIRAGWPNLGPAAIERLLKNTALPLEGVNPLYAGGLGAGLVNVAGIREALVDHAAAGAVATGAVGAGAVAAGAAGAGRAAAGTAYHTPQGFVDLLKLQPAVPVRIVPAGRYPGIKFLLQPPGGVGLPNVRVELFHDGQRRDTVIRGSELKYPFMAAADSIYLFRSGPAGRGKNPGTGSRAGAGPAGAWWAYTALTIDSSTWYCGSTVPISVTGEGYLEDGSGAANYTGRNDCKWQLTAPPGKKLQLNFEQFDTEPKIDQVYLFSGNSTKDPILAIFSGHKLPPPIKSWNESVLVWFITNEENNFQGWRLHYKVVD